MAASAQAKKAAAKTEIQLSAAQELDRRLAATTLAPAARSASLPTAAPPEKPDSHIQMRKGSFAEVAHAVVHI